jgi:serine/threonine protein kinase
MVDLVSATLTQIDSFIDSSPGSVYLGKDIRTGAEVALKIGGTGQSPSRLKHEYTVYTNIAGSTGISPVLWYGKEGSYEVIVFNNLGKSLGDLMMDEDRFDGGRVFLYASQMVRS